MLFFFLLHFKMRSRSNDMEKGELCRWILGGWMVEVELPRKAVLQMSFFVRIDVKEMMAF